MWRGLRGGPVERVGDLHQEKQDLRLQVGSGDEDEANREKAAQGHNTLSDYRRVQEVQNGHQALRQKRGGREEAIQSTKEEIRKAEVPGASTEPA